jgi:hypothetical protein
MKKTFIPDAVPDDRIIYGTVFNHEQKEKNAILVQRTI